ncbi:hypothetical protein Tco_0378172 [Tanacetum coccineum]
MARVAGQGWGEGGGGGKAVGAKFSIGVISCEKASSRGEGDLYAGLQGQLGISTRGGYVRGSAVVQYRGESEGIMEEQGMRKVSDGYGCKAGRGAGKSSLLMRRTARSRAKGETVGAAEECLASALSGQVYAMMVGTRELTVRQSRESGRWCAQSKTYYVGDMVLVSAKDVAQRVVAPECSGHSSGEVGSEEDLRSARSGRLRELARKWALRGVRDAGEWGREYACSRRRQSQRRSNRRGRGAGTVKDEEGGGSAGCLLYATGAGKPVVQYDGRAADACRVPERIIIGWKLGGGDGYKAYWSNLLSYFSADLLSKLELVLFIYFCVLLCGSSVIEEMSGRENGRGWDYGVFEKQSTKFRDVSPSCARGGQRMYDSRITGCIGNRSVLRGVIYKRFSSRVLRLIEHGKLQKELLSESTYQKPLPLSSLKWCLSSLSLFRFRIVGFFWKGMPSNNG